jgi:hypothetical protein
MLRHVAAVAVAICVSPSFVGAQDVQTSQQLMVSTPSASVHKSPTVASPVIGKAPRGTALEITREVGDWVKVSWPDDKDGFGYVHRTMGSIHRGSAAPRRVTGFSPTRPMAPAQSPSTSMSNDQIEVREQAPSIGTVYIPPPTHFVGIGGRISGSTLGYGVSGRAWSRKHLGVQVDVVRSSQSSVTTGERMTSVQFAPSVLYGFRDYVTDYVWVRPHFGGGVSLHRVTLSAATPAVTSAVAESKFGVRAFAGTELTFASVPRFAVSVDMGYDSSKAPFDGFELGGIGFAVSGHWYFK